MSRGKKQVKNEHNLEVVQRHNHFGLVVVVRVVLGVGGTQVLGKRLVRVCLQEHQ
jgi:hypothetical protein